MQRPCTTGFLVALFSAVLFTAAYAQSSGTSGGSTGGTTSGSTTTGSTTTPPPDSGTSGTAATTPLPGGTTNPNAQITQPGIPGAVSPANPNAASRQNVPNISGSPVVTRPSTVPCGSGTAGNTGAGTVAGTPRIDSSVAATGC